MKIETIKNIFNFLNEKEGKELPEAWFYVMEKFDLIKELENHRDGTQYKYDGYLNLSDTNITKLPNDLYVVGDLNLTNCKQLTKLPDNLYVEDSIYIGGTSIEEIPNNLYVGWNLCMFNNPLMNKYSNDDIREMVISKGGKIKASIIR